MVSTPQKEKKYVFGINGKGVWLEDFEVELLWLIAKHEYLNSKQVYFYHELFSSLPEASVRTKLSRWKQKGVVETELVKYKGRYGNHHNLIRLAKNGVKILKEEGYIPSEKDYPLFGNFYSKEISDIDHYFGAKQIAIKTLINMRRWYNDIESLSRKEIPYFDREAGNGLMLIEPDWVLKKDNRIVNIELDTGKQSHASNKDKVERYIKLAKDEPDREHIVLFAVIDDSMPTIGLYTKSRTRRINNMKSEFLAMPQVKHLEQPNISIYVTSLKRANIISEMFLSGVNSYHPDKKNMELSIATKALGDENSLFGYQLEAISNEELYLPKANPLLYADAAYRLNNKSGTVSEKVLFVLMEEGNILSLDRLQYLSSAILMGNMKVHVNKIIAIYSKETELNGDIIGTDLPNVLFVSNENLMKNMNEEPIFYRIGRQNKWEAVSYEGLPVTT